MRKVLSRVLLVVAMVAAIVGLIYLGVSIANPGDSSVLISGQACVYVGLFIFVTQNLIKKIRR